MKHIISTCLILLVFQPLAAQQAQTASQLIPRQVKDKWGYADKKGLFTSDKPTDGERAANAPCYDN